MENEIKNDEQSLVGQEPAEREMGRFDAPLKEEWSGAQNQTQQIPPQDYQPQGYQSQQNQPQGYQQQDYQPQQNQSQGYQPQDYQPQQYQPQGYQPQYSAIPPKKHNKHQGLAIASLVLGGISILCCWFYGLSLVPAVIGFVFGLISVIGGEGSARVMGGIGLGLSALGVILSLMMIASLISVINWDNITPEAFQSYRNIDPTDEESVRRWLQQFFNVDISSGMPSMYNSTYHY